MSPRSRSHRRKPTRRSTRTQGRQRSGSATKGQVTTGRYTPPRHVRFRPTSHKAIGGVILGVGLLVVILNYLEEFELNTMPGPHSALYFLLGMAIAAYSTWWFGWFDRTR